jgi:hypothetical protein
MSTLGVDLAGFTKVGPFWDTNGHNVRSNTHASAVPTIWTFPELAQFCANWAFGAFYAEARMALIVAITWPVKFALFRSVTIRFA